MEKGRFLPPTNTALAMVEDHRQDAGLCPAHGRQGGPPSGGGTLGPSGACGGGPGAKMWGEEMGH